MNNLEEENWFLEKSALIGVHFLDINSSKKMLKGLVFEPGPRS